MKYYNAAYQFYDGNDSFLPSYTYVIAVEDNEGENEVLECLKKLAKKDGVKYSLLDPIEIEYTEGKHLPPVIAKDVIED